MPPPSLTITFLGAATLLISDGATHLLTDGFFTRPPALRVAFGRLRSDPVAVRAGLARAGIRRLDAVLVSHSHYDHALDAPEVARAAGAQVVGSASTANLARGAGLPEAQITVAVPARALAFGAFHVTFLPSVHSAPNLAAGQIDTPLRLPARASAFKEGGCYSILVEHPAGALLVHASAAYLPGALSAVRADAALLSLGSLGRRSSAFQSAYFDATAGATGARVVCPIHHDDFTHPLGERLRHMPWWMDDIPAALDALRTWAAARGVRVAELQPWQPVRLLETLESD